MSPSLSNTVRRDSISLRRASRWPAYIALGLLLLSGQPGSAFQAKAPAGPKPAPKFTLSPIAIDDVHENDLSVSGIAPVPNVGLTVKINGVAGVSTANSNATGRFAIVLAQKAQAGNFVEVSGTAPGNVAIHGSTTVLAAAQTAAAAPKPVTLSKPSIAVVHDGDATLTLSQNPADAAQSDLNLHVELIDAVNPAKVAWEGDCTPDSKTGSCTVTPNPPLPVSGQLIHVTETLVSSGKKNTSPVTSATVVAAQGLGVPTIAASEGSPIIAITPAKADAGRSGLVISATVIGPDLKAVPGLAGSCEPDSAGDACSIALSKRLKGNWKIQAKEVATSATGVTVIADVTPLAALGKPTITQPHEGDKTVTVTLNTADATAVKPPASLKIRVKVTTAPKTAVKPSGPQDCKPIDSTSQCQVRFESPLIIGDVVTAREIIDDETHRERESDAVATANVINDSLGVPVISKVVETNTSANITLNKNDFDKFAGKLSIAVDLYDGPDPVAGQSMTCSPADSTKDFCAVTFTALAAGQTLHAHEIPAAGATGAPSKPGPETVAEVQELGYNWGRVRAYFSTGAVFSRSTITTPSGSTTPAVTTSNFNSPDAFVAFDMDFNWFTKQGCLSAAYVSHPVKIATLADAVNQCDASVAKHDGKKPAATDKTPLVPTKQIGALLANADPIASAASATSDPTVVTVLEFLSRYYGRGTNPNSIPRLDVLIKALEDCAGAKNLVDPELSVCRREHLVELTSLELTSHEARQILNSTDGFEKRQRWGYLVNSYFQTKLTQTAASNGFALATSPNSVHIEGGIYTPIYFPWSRWTYRHQPYAMFVAPIAKLGFDSLRGSATDQLTLASPAPANPTAGQTNYQNAADALSKDVYRMMAFGTRLGFFGFSPTPSRAPELVSYIDFTYGRFDNFFTQKYNDPTGAIRFPWRMDMTGTFKVPATPLYVGVDLNKGVGPDALSIFVGLRTDLSSLLAKLIPTIQ